MAHKKISEFLSTLDSHGIYDADALAEDFTKQTGEQPCWNTSTVAQTRKAIAGRGLGGHVAGTAKQTVYFQQWNPKSEQSARRQP